MLDNIVNHILSYKMNSWLKYLRLIAMVITATLLLLFIASPASASPGLKVDNAAIVANISPGQKITQKITVSIADDDPATDIAVCVSGVAQNISGGFQLLSASWDNGSYSARTFVTVDKSSFHLEPGGSQDITATIQMPQDVGNGGRYAIIEISAQPVPGSGVGIITAIDVPVYLTIENSQLIHTGSITDISTGNITSGQPVAIFTDFQNTGNHHYKIKGEVAVIDSSGQVLGTVEIPLTAGSLVPGMTRRLDTSFVPQGELAAGKYTIDSRVMLEDGTLLGESTSSFEVGQDYTPPPGTVAGLSSTSSNETPRAAIYFNWMTFAALGAMVAVVVLIVTVHLIRKRR
jgi:hypothetical protein